MTQVQTVWELLSIGGDDAIAFAAPGRLPLTYGKLRDHIKTTIATLNQCGIGRNDRVAIVVPNGPEMASAFVSFATGMTTASQRGVRILSIRSQCKSPGSRTRQYFASLGCGTRTENFCARANRKSRGACGRV